MPAGQSETGGEHWGVFLLPLTPGAQVPAEKAVGGAFRD